nr:retrovirus-related Pol polyprotein from transposon TNT 1-94 [Tanacetum cinerariifolium]
MTGNLKHLSNFVDKFLGTVKFGNDQIAPILGYEDLVQGNITIKRVYYVKGLNHNLFSIGQFCDADLEVAFQKSTCYIHDLKGNDLLTGSRGTNLYSITLQDTSTPNPIFLMAKASLSQAWLWHRLLSHLNINTINLLSKYDIVTGLPKLKFVKDHLCSSEIEHQMSTARTPEQNGVVKRQNRTLVEAARTMLSASLSLSPGPQSQENVPQIAETLTTSNELDLLFSLMFDVLLNGTTTVVSKSSDVTAADVPNQRQQQNISPSTSTTVVADTITNGPRWPKARMDYPKSTQGRSPPMGLVLVLYVKMFYKNLSMPLTSLKELVTYADVVAFVKDGYDHGNKVELYTEHFGYNVLEMINNELNEDASVHKSSSGLDSSDDDYDPLDDLTDLVDFQAEGDDNLDIPKITSDDPWLNKLVGKGNFIGMKGKKPNPKPSVEEPKVGESSKQGEKGVCSEKADKATIEKPSTWVTFSQRKEAEEGYAALPPPWNSDGLRTAEACGDCDRGSRGRGGGVCIDGEFSGWEFEDEDVGLNGLICGPGVQNSRLTKGRMCGGVLRGTLLTKGGDDMPKGFNLDGVLIGVVDEVRGFTPCGDLIGEGVVEGVIGVMVGVEGVIGLIAGGDLLVVVDGIIRGAIVAGLRRGLLQVVLVAGMMGIGLVLSGGLIDVVLAGLIDVVLIAGGGLLVVVDGIIRGAIVAGLRRGLLQVVLVAGMMGIGLVLSGGLIDVVLAGLIDVVLIAGGGLLVVVDGIIRGAIVAGLRRGLLQVVVVAGMVGIGLVLSGGLIDVVLAGLRGGCVRCGGVATAVAGIRGGVCWVPEDWPGKYVDVP